MTDREFFLETQEDWYTEFVDTEIREILAEANTHDEFFEFDDVPF